MCRSTPGPGPTAPYEGHVNGDMDGRGHGEAGVRERGPDHACREEATPLSGDLWGRHAEGGLHDPPLNN